MHVYLEIIVSLVALYIIFSIINSAFLEALMQIFNERGRFLRKKLKNFFRKDGQGAVDFVEELYNSQLISAFKKKTRYPAYIDKTVFSQSLMEILFTDTDKNDRTIINTKREDRLQELPEELQKSMNYILEKVPKDVGSKLEYIQKEIEVLYEAYMLRVSTWYKAQMRVLLGVIGIAFALTFNLDSVAFFDILKENGKLRKSYYELGVVLNEHRDEITIDSSRIKGLLNREGVDSIKNANFMNDLVDSIIPEGMREEINPADLNIGWKKFKLSLGSVLGVLLTGIALSFGSTFWFGILQKLVPKT